MALSLGVETIQLFTRVGSFDVDDILLNTIGGVLGYFSIIEAFMLPDIELKKYFLNSLWIFKNLVTDEEMTICDRGKTAALFL